MSISKDVPKTSLPAPQAFVEAFNKAKDPPSYVLRFLRQPVEHIKVH